MVSVAWLTCPHCEKKFYVEKPQLDNDGAEWFCPFCKKVFTAGEALKVWA